MLFLYIKTMVCEICGKENHMIVTILWIRKNIANVLYFRIINHEFLRNYTFIYCDYQRHFWVFDERDTNWLSVYSSFSTSHTCHIQYS